MSSQITANFQLADTVNERADAVTPVRLWNAADQVTSVAWNDPTVEQLAGAIQTDSDATLVWWTPSLGPIAVLAAHRFARCANDGPTLWSINDIARTFGCLTVAKVSRTLDRLERFGITHRDDLTIAVRLWLPPLTHRQRCCLPGYLAAGYDNSQH